AASGTVRAARLLPDGRLGVAGRRDFIGLSPRGWKVVAVDNEDASHPATFAIDGDPATWWNTRWGDDVKLPHAITVDMGRAHRIAGLVYLPRQDGQLGGTAENYRFDTSEDGVHWSAAIERGTFANIRNNPDSQQARFAPVSARYFRFTALDEVWRGGATNAAELSVIPADAE
ncbi:coagulation factor 5/8 type domain-containing protein, partial [Rugamonas sp. FT107W]